MTCSCTADEWTVRLEGDLGEVPYPFDLPPGDELAARRRADKWRERRPEVSVTLLRRSRWVTAGEWTVAA